MSTTNPTPLRIGMIGSLGDREYRIAGRVVLSMEEAGETYFWNEFFLRETAGNGEATLVFELTEKGPVWRLFQLFTPGNPLDVEQASKLRVGAVCNLDGLKAEVELLGESKVELIEGEAPEGVERGDRATFFNAWIGDSMLVVSWTGGEVEHFLGENLSVKAVSQAFGVQLLAREHAFPLANGVQESGGPSFKLLGAIGLFLLLAGFALSGLTDCSNSDGSKEVARLAPRALLIVGKSGRLAGQDYTVVAERLLEIARANGTHFTEEYLLRSAKDGSQVRLLQGTERAESESMLAIPAEGTRSLTPEQAGALRIGSTVVLAGETLTVKQLYRSQAKTRKTTPQAGPEPASCRYGLMARSAKSLWLVEWNEQSINSEICIIIPEQQLKEAFKN